MPDSTTLERPPVSDSKSENSSPTRPEENQDKPKIDRGKALAFAITEYGKLRYDNPDAVLENIQNPPAETDAESADSPSVDSPRPEESQTESPLDLAKQKLDSSRQAYVDARFGLKGIFKASNAEQKQQTHDAYIQSLKELRDLKMTELRTKLDSDQSLSQIQPGHEKSQAQLLIEEEMRSFTAGEFRHLQDAENNIKQERVLSKFGETGKKFIDWYGGINKRIADKFIGQNASWAKQAVMGGVIGFTINSGVNIATGGTLNVGMRLLSGAVTAERFNKAFEARAAQKTRESMNLKIQEGLQEASTDTGNVDINKANLFLDTQIDSMDANWQKHKTGRLKRVAASAVAAYAISLASRTASGYAREWATELADTDTGKAIINTGKNLAADTGKVITNTAQDFKDFLTPGANSAEASHAVTKPEFRSWKEMFKGFAKDATTNWEDLDHKRPGFIDPLTTTHDHNPSPSQPASTNNEPIQPKPEPNFFNKFKETSKNIISSLLNPLDTENLSVEKKSTIPPVPENTGTHPAPSTEQVPEVLSADAVENKTPSASTPETPPQKPIIIEAKKGDSIWKIIDQKLGEQNLDNARRTHAIDNIKDGLAKLSSDEIKNLGISSGDINDIKIGEKIDLTKYLQENQLNKNVVDAKDISDAKAASITANNARIKEYFSTHNTQATSENIDKLLRGQLDKPSVPSYDRSDIGDPEIYPPQPEPYPPGTSQIYADSKVELYGKTFSNGSDINQPFLNNFIDDMDSRNAREVRLGEYDPGSYDEKFSDNLKDFIFKAQEAFGPQIGNPEPGETVQQYMKRISRLSFENHIDLNSTSSNTDTIGQPEDHKTGPDSQTGIPYEQYKAGMNEIYGEISGKLYGDVFRESGKSPKFTEKFIDNMNEQQATEVIDNNPFEDHNRDIYEEKFSDLLRQQIEKNQATFGPELGKPRPDETVHQYLTRISEYKFLEENNTEIVSNEHIPAAEMNISEEAIPSPTAQSESPEPNPPTPEPTKQPALEQTKNRVMPRSSESPTGESFSVITPNIDAEGNWSPVPPSLEGTPTTVQTADSTPSSPPEQPPPAASEAPTEIPANLEQKTEDEALKLLNVLVNPKDTKFDDAQERLMQERVSEINILNFARRHALEFPDGTTPDRNVSYNDRESALQKLADLLPRLSDQIDNIGDNDNKFSQAEYDKLLAAMEDEKNYPGLKVLKKYFDRYGINLMS
jgi:hypothetical protein